MGVDSSHWVCFSHGLESGPSGLKINALSKVAQQAGWEVESLDYRGINDPHERVAKLESWCDAIKDPYLLVGSSMGGHVAAAAAAGDCRDPLGLFLMAPAFYVPGYAELTPQAPACPTVIVHGWHDEVIPWQNSARFAERSGCGLILVDDDHRLASKLDHIAKEFEWFLASLVPPANLINC